MNFDIWRIVKIFIVIAVATIVFSMANRSIYLAWANIRLTAQVTVLEKDIMIRTRIVQDLDILNKQLRCEINVYRLTTLVDGMASTACQGILIRDYYAPQSVE